MLTERLEADLKSAMRAGDSARVSVLRLTLSAIRNREIAAKSKETGLLDEEVIAVLKAEARKRRDAAAEFRKGGRPETAAKEESEAEMLQFYLPEEATDEEIEKAVESAIRETGASGVGDFGKAMKAAMAALKGRADGSRVSAAVKKVLSAGGSET